VRKLVRVQTAEKGLKNRTIDIRKRQGFGFALDEGLLEFSAEDGGVVADQRLENDEFLIRYLDNHEKLWFSR
jgi:hypothetical protein